MTYFKNNRRIVVGAVTTAFIIFFVIGALQKDIIDKNREKMDKVQRALQKK